MSGHSKWSTIKRQKEANDHVKGKLFSKMGRAISVAVKAGGGSDPASNYKLRVVIDQARASNMPKSNIERAVSKASEVGNIEEVTYEGFGPAGVSVIVETATDNRNRTGQEMKNVFERSGGSLGGPGSVAFNFDSKGLIVVEKNDAEKQILELIDAGVEDFEETEDGIEVYVSPTKVSEKRQDLEDKGFKIMSASLVKKPKNLVSITDKDAALKVVSFLEKIEENEDVQEVFANVNIPQELVG